MAYGTNGDGGHDDRSEGRDPAGESGEAHPFPRAMRGTIGRESTTFGFSILVTVTFGLVNSLEGPPGPPQIFLYATGAVFSFTLLTGILSGGFRKPMPQHHTATLALATSLNVVSVLAGLALAWLTAELLEGAASWLVTPFVATLSYLIIESAEEALAERILKSAGEPEADEVTS